MNELSIKQVLNKAYLKVRPDRASITQFKTNFTRLLDTIQGNPGESEEFLKNAVADFLKNTFYGDYCINTKGRIDLVIHGDADTASPVKVIIEAKRYANSAGMISREKPDTKALQEILLYFLRERITENNIHLKHLIITDSKKWFIFDAADFEKLFSNNKQLVADFKDFENGYLIAAGTDFFYKNIASPYIDKHENELNFTFFEIGTYEKILRDNSKENDNKLIGLYKLLSPEHLLRLPFENDSNSLNEDFYRELLYIMGLCEIKDGGKKTIQRPPEPERQSGSLLESVIFQLSDRDIGDESAMFEAALELVITWVNRVLFLKLLEAQQLRYQHDNKTYAFMNIKTIKNFSDLNTLFFKVLAVRSSDRTANLRERCKNIPYLNSSLFDRSGVETEYITIDQLGAPDIAISGSTVLKDSAGKKRGGSISLLEYLFDFLDAYDFSSEGAEEIQETKKTLISASVLGLIFEKMNGYRDGAFFTPGFITTYICRETLRLAVVQKFNDAMGWQTENLTGVLDNIKDKEDGITLRQANEIVNSIRICDPAVGSGHFLVSALNEVIAVKSQLRILCDTKGKRLSGYTAEVVNDELVIFDEDHELFVYNYRNAESRRVQEAIFNEKRAIIENCLFGVDINGNSVHICRLRLWIELLKNAYYTEESAYTELETLPNLDFKILSGDSLPELRKCDLFNDVLLDELSRRKEHYFYMTDKRERRLLENRIHEIIHELTENGVTFDYRLFFPEVFKGGAYGDGGFDVVLGNPPYIDHKKLKALAAKIKNDYTVYSGTADISAYFIEKGLRLCREGGILAYITTNKFFTTEYGRTVREFILRYRIDLLVNFEQCAVFEKALVSTVIMKLTKTPPEKGHTFIYGGFYGEDHEAIEAHFPAYGPNFGVYKQSLLDEGEWSFSDSTTVALRKKIERGAVNLGDLEGVAIYRGVTTGYNPAFIIDRETRKALIAEDPANKRIIKPLLQGRNIRKWVYRKSGKYLLLTGFDTDIKSDYPAVFKHMEPYQQEMERRDDQGKNWWNLRACTYYREFERREKIIWGLTADKWAFAYDDKKHYLPSNGYILTSKKISIKYLLALLNSSLMRFYFGFIGTMTAGGAYTLKRGTIEKLPVIIPSTPVCKKIERLIDTILDAKAADPQADTSALEAEVDRLVYGLYNLSEEEIKMVNGV